MEDHLEEKLAGNPTSVAFNDDSSEDTPEVENKREYKAFLKREKHIFRIDEVAPIKV